MQQCVISAVLRALRHFQKKKIYAPLRRRVLFYCLSYLFQLSSSRDGNGGVERTRRELSQLCRPAGGPVLPPPPSRPESGDE